MTSGGTTPTITLTLYDASVTDQAVTFSNYRAVQSGSASTSNMYRIDTAIAADRARLTALESTRGAIFVPALFISSNYYEATGITEITSLSEDMTIILTVDTESSGTVTLNINSLGTKTVSKINGAGAVVNLSGTDLKIGRNYLFRYDGTQWIWVSTTDPMFIEETIHAATAKSSLVDADEMGVIDSAASWILKKVTLAVLKLFIYAGIKPADGTMWNGKITPSVATNDLTLALKTFAGTDPSATDPVYITIGGTVRTITSALSVTKLDATNWFNAGGAELATKEVDYFVYLGYNATDGVVIGFSRIPYANLYSDFSTTSTNEKYAGISTITNAAAGDNYVNIGRFAATLSAGAGYTWTVPTYTTANLIQRPIFTTRALTSAGTITAETGTITSATGNGYYTINNRQATWFPVIAITTNGTGATKLRCTYPFAPDADLTYGTGAYNAATGTGLFGVLRSAGSGYASFAKIDNTYPGGDGSSIVTSFVYNI